MAPLQQAHASFGAGPPFLALLEPALLLLLLARGPFVERSGTDTRLTPMALAVVSAAAD